MGGFISLVWLREQILSGGGPDWLENNPNQQPIVRRQGNAAPVAVAAAHLENVFVNNDNNEQEALNENEVAIQDDNHHVQVQHQPLHQQQQQQQPQDNMWNPNDWDRVAEDLTWDRVSVFIIGFKRFKLNVSSSSSKLLGLDGSLQFLEHVFWVISLNTLFILVFGKFFPPLLIFITSKLSLFTTAFVPYHMGHYIIYGFKFQEYIEKTNFEGLLTTIVGYVIFALILIAFFIVMSISSFHR